MTLTTFKRFFSNTPHAAKLGMVMIITSYILCQVTVWVDAYMRSIDPTYPPAPVSYLITVCIVALLGVAIAIIVFAIYMFSNWVLEKI